MCSSLYYSLEYFRMFKEFSEATESCSKKAVSLINSVATYAQTDEKKRIELPDDIENPLFYESIVDILDVLLDSADTHIKLARSGMQSPPSKIQNLDVASIIADKDRIIKAPSNTVPKPQLLFLDEIDNSRDRPFRPRLTKKYHFWFTNHIQF